jgi:endo-1,4-beta-xylanase
MYKLLKIVLFFIFTQTTFSQEQNILAQGEKVVNKNGLKSLKLKKDIGDFNTFQVENEVIHKATTITKPEGVFHLSVKIPVISNNIKAGQPLLISFKAKSIQASLETNEAKVNWIFKQTESAAPKDITSKSVSLSANWQTYYIPFKAIHSENLDKTTFAMQFGYAPQVFEIKDIELYVFPETFDFKKLPYTKITYSGMEENAIWRTEALKRIEETRKGNFSLFFYKDNQPLQNAQVEIKQIKHHFRFGAAVSTDEILNKEKYFEIVKKLFNIVVFENDLKSKRWRNEKNRPATIEAIDKLTLNNIEVKGHVLLWPGFQYLPDSYEKNKSNPKKIQQLINENYTSILTATKGKIAHWDVLNEAYTNKDIPEIFGSNEVLFDAFKKSKELDPKAKRYINEYGILSGGGTNTKKQDWYFNFIQEIDKKTNGAIDGLGMQSHIGTDLTPPTKVIEILNRFAKLNKEISISEFTIDIMDDDELRAKYTRDYMIAVFSNPAVKEFLFWGFYAPMHPKAALVDENYQLTKMGQAYYDLVFKEWMTKSNKTTNEIGLVFDKGFYGTYVFTIKKEGKTYQGTFEVLPNEKNKIKINLQ